MVHIDKAYLLRLSTTLRNFKAKSRNVYQFSCPICGDSQSNKLKARMYAYEKHGKLIVHCHNCSITTTFARLLDSVNPTLYREYKLEKFKNQHPQTSALGVSDDSAIAARVTRPVLVKDPLVSLDELSDEHPAVEYVMSRHIPRNRWKDLFWAVDFKQYILENFPSASHENLVDKDPRIVMYLTDLDGRVTHINARSLDPNSIRYIKLKLVESDVKVFGLDRVDPSRTIFVLEGEFNSMFIDNAVASGGASAIGHLVEALFQKFDPLAVSVYDNEPRNLQIVNMMKKAIKAGNRIVIWPESFPTGDINELVLAEKLPSNVYDVAQILGRISYMGLEAQLRLNEWRKFR